MKHHKNDIASFYCREDFLPYVSGLCFLVKDHPFILEHVRGVSDESKDIFQKAGFQIYPTVAATTLLYHQEADSFFKMLHPVSFRHKVKFSLCNRAQQIYSLSENLLSHEVKVPIITAFGNFRIERTPFFVMKRIEGRSLYDYLIREGSRLPFQTYFNVIDKVTRLHRLGYWLGDAHLSHVFIEDNEVSGFIDIDSIRRNTPFSLKKLAKDLAGLNHPKLPLAGDEKKTLFQHYIKAMGINNEKSFSELVKRYSEQRWKGSA